MSNETSSFADYNVKDELVLFGQDHTKFVKKYGQKAELQQALWKKLYKLCKNCNTDDGSKDWNASLGKDTTINTTHMTKNMGFTFFHFFHQHDIADKQKKKCADFITDKLSPNKDDYRIWLNLLKKRLELWSGKELVDNQKDSDRDAEPLQALKNWQYAFQLLEDNIVNSSSVFKIYLALSERIFGGKVGSTVTHMMNMDTWREYMVWAIRSKFGEMKYLKLALQPVILASLNNDDFEIKRVRLFWQIGRCLAVHGKLNGEEFGMSIGEGFRWCRDPEDGYKPTQQHYHLAAEMICHLCVPPIDIPFRTDNIKKLVKPLIPTEFLKIAPALTQELIKLICLYDTKTAELTPETISHTMTCFLSAAGKCSTEILPCLERIAEFIDKQAKSKQATAIIKDFIARVPAKLIQTRFHSEDTEVGFSTIAMTLLKVTLKGFHLEEAKKLIGVILGAEEHLAALDQISIILKAESERPSHSIDLILRIWTLAAEIFRERISRGQEVSNNPKSTDMSSIYSFMVITHGLVDPVAAHTNQSSIKKFRVEYKAFLKIVLNSASTLPDFTGDKFISSIIQDLDTGLRNLGPQMTLQILESLIQKEPMQKGFDDRQNTASKNQKHYHALKLVETISEKSNFKNLASGPIESSLEIISCVLSELTDDHFNTAARLLPNYARLALENRKNPAWQQSVDCIIRIIAQIEKSNRNASKMYDSLERFFILLLSESSSRRIKILAAQAWEIKFKNENLSLGDEFWKFIEPYYIDGKWTYPTGRTVLAELNSSELNNKPSLGTPKRDFGKSDLGRNRVGGGGTPNRTPQRLNRQQAAMAALTSGGTPKSGRRGSKPISSTFVSKNDDSDFVSVESPISFNKRKLSEKQKEKMREKKQEQGHIPAMYSACDNSQSRSQYLEDTQTNSNGTQIRRPSSPKGIRLMDPDESAVDFSAADFATNANGPMSSTFSVQNNIDLDKTSGIKTNTDIDDSYNDTTVMDDKTAEETIACKTINKTFDMTAGSGIQGDMDYTNDDTAMEVISNNDDSVTMNLDKTGGVACGTTFNADQTEDVTMGDETVDNDNDDVIDNNKTVDETNGIGCGVTFDVTKDATTLDDVTTEEPMKPNQSLPKPVLEAVVISSDEDGENEVKTEDDSEIVCMGEANDSVDIYAEDPEDCEEGTEEFDTAIEEGQTTPPPPVVDITGPTPRKEDSSDKMPTPDFGSKKSSFAVVTESTAIGNEIESCSKTTTRTEEDKEDETDLNMSMGSLPALSEDEDEVDQDEESLHEPFANSTFATSEIKESIAVRKSPSILKRKRSSIDPNEPKKRKGDRKSVSFSDPFQENTRNRLSTRGKIGGLSPSARRLSRSGRMLQMANKGETVKMLAKEQSTGGPQSVTGVSVVVDGHEDDLVLSNGEKYLKMLRDERDDGPRQRTEAEKNKLRKMMLDLCSAMNELC